MTEIPAQTCPAIWNAVPFAALVLDPEDRVQDANSAAEVFFGLSTRSLTGRSLESMFGPASRVAVHTTPPSGWARCPWRRAASS